MLLGHAVQIQIAVGRQQQVLVAAPHIPERHPGSFRERSAIGQPPQLGGQRLRAVDVSQYGEVVDAYRLPLAVLAPFACGIRVDDDAARRRKVYSSSVHTYPRVVLSAWSARSGSLLQGLVAKLQRLRDTARDVTREISVTGVSSAR